MRKTEPRGFFLTDSRGARSKSFLKFIREIYSFRRNMETKESGEVVSPTPGHRPLFFFLQGGRGSTSDLPGVHKVFLMSQVKKSRTRLPVHVHQERSDAAPILEFRGDLSFKMVHITPSRELVVTRGSVNSCASGDSKERKDKTVVGRAMTTAKILSPAGLISPRIINLDSQALES